MIFLVVQCGYESWTIKKAEQWRIDTFELWCWTLESSLDSREIKSVSHRGNQPWISIGRTDAEALILWLPDAKIQLIAKDPDAGKDWEQEEKWATENEMVGCLNGHEFEQTPGDGEGQGSLVYCSPYSRKELDTTEQLNNNNKNVSSSNAISTSLPGSFKLSLQSPWVKAHWNAKCFLVFISLQFCLQYPSFWPINGEILRVVS